MGSRAKVSSPAAKRMRRHRERRRNGLRHVAFDLHDSQVDFLIRKGHVRADERHDQGALARAAHSVLDSAFKHSRRRERPGYFSVELGETEIEHLVRRGRLAARARDDPDAVLEAFSDVLHEAFGRL